MKNVNVLNDKNLENVAGGNWWNDYWGEGEPYKAPPRDTMHLKDTELDSVNVGLDRHNIRSPLTD